jgi:hypothetical protein
MPPRFPCIAAFLSLFALIAVAPAPAQEPSRKADFETVLKHFNSGHRERGNFVITSREEWESVWRATMSNAFPVPPAPEIDFDRHSLIAVFQGEKPSSGYSISISKLMKSGRKFKVKVKEVIPQDSCFVLMVITNPVHIILTERIESPERVTFRIQQQFTECPPQQ